MKNDVVSRDQVADGDSAATNGGAFKVANIGGGESRGELSRQWVSRPADQRFTSLNDLKRAVAARAATSQEHRIQSRDFELIAPEATDSASLQRLTIGLDNGDERALTNWSFSQLCGLAKAPAGYLKTLPSQIVADNLNYSLRYTRETEAVKSYSNADEMLAVTGPDYGRIFDHEVVDAVQMIAGNGTGDTRWKIPGVMDWRTMIYDPNHPVTAETTTLYASDRDVFMFLVDDRNPVEVGKTATGEPDLMFRGFYVSNSEVGSSSLKIAAFYLRAVCCNRIMWGVEGFEEISMRHSKLAPARFIEQARPALASFADGSAKRLIDGVEKAKAAKLVENDENAVDFLANRGFSRSRALAVMEAVEREEHTKARMAWDFAQGITAVARNEIHTDTRVGLENEARKILDKVAA